MQDRGAPILSMSRWVFAVLWPLGLAGWVVSGSTKAGAAPEASLDLVPWPRSARIETGHLSLSSDSRIVAVDGELAPLARILSDEILMATGLRIPPSAGGAGSGDIALAIDAAEKGDAYTVSVSDKALVTAGDYEGVAMGTVTLLQAIVSRDGEVLLPRVTIDDAPGASYRGLLVDVARNWHSIETLKQIVILCRFYKIRYLQLHLTDDQSFMFPSSAYPALTTQNQHGHPAYTLDELRELERFAAGRGVAIVPELEVPGHAAAMVRTMPDLFKIKGTKPHEHHATINFASNDVLRALDTIVGEVCQVFTSSPYFHIGGDEADITFANQHPDFAAAFKEYGLGEQGQWQLYRRFLVQMDDIVTEHGKQMIVWEGFGRDRESQFQIPKSVIVMEYECPFYPPEWLVEDGRTFINAAWTPLYVVNRHRWSPEKIYNWNMYLLGQFSTNYSLTQWHQLKKTPLVIGAQMCAWEQPEAVELSSLRGRLAAMSERIWNPDLGRSYADFAGRLKATDRLFGKLIPSVTFSADGLAPPDKDEFDAGVFYEAVTLTMRTDIEGARIRYTLDGKAPGADSTRYTEPIVIRDTTLVRAASFDADGKPLGYQMGEVYYREPKIEPNLATGKPVTVSGGTQGPQRPELAVDGKVRDPQASWWASPWPQWLQVDLGREYTIDRVKVYPYWDGTRYYQYTVEASVDGRDWTRIVDMRENTKPATSEGDERRFAAVRARYVRVNMLRNSANEGVHLVELMVFEAG